MKVILDQVHSFLFVADVDNYWLPWEALQGDENHKATERETKIKAIEDYIGVFPDGNFQPLTLRQRMFFRTPLQKLEYKLSKVRVKSKEIIAAVGTFRTWEEDMKDSKLIKYFILECLSPFKRHALEVNSRGYEAVSASKPSWPMYIFAWMYVILTIMFSIYWIFAWGVYEGSQILGEWGAVLGTSLAKDIFLIQVTKIFILYYLPAKAMQPQLLRIRQVLGDISTSLINKEEDVIDSKGTEDINVVQHMSAACRAARSKQLSTLSASMLLRQLDDNDMRMCRQGRLDYLGLISFVAIALPMTVILLNGLVGDAVIDAVIPGIYAGLIVGIADLYTVSLLALLIPICISVGIVCYLTFVFHPAQIAYKKRKEKMKRLELEASYLHTSTNRHPAKSSTRGGHSHASQYSPIGYFRRVFKIFVRAAQHGISWLSFEKQLNNTKQKRIDKIWGLMNAPQCTQVHTVNPPDSAERFPFSRKSSMSARNSSFLPPTKITDMMTSSSQWKALYLERQNQNNFNSNNTNDPNTTATATASAGGTAGADADAAIVLPIVTRPVSYRSSRRKVSTLFVFDARDLLIRLKLQLVVGKKNDEVSVEKLRDAFEEIIEVFYPDGIPLSDVERSEASDLFKRWKDRDSDCPKGVTSVQCVSMLAFEEWFMQEFMCVFRSTLPERLVDHSLRYVPDHKQRKSSITTTPSNVKLPRLPVPAPAVEKKKKPSSRIHPLASSLVISLDEVYGMSQSDMVIEESPLNRNRPINRGML